MGFTPENRVDMGLSELFEFVASNHSTIFLFVPPPVTQSLNCGISNDIYTPSAIEIEEPYIPMLIPLSTDMNMALLMIRYRLSPPNDRFAEFG